MHQIKNMKFYIISFIVACIILCCCTEDTKTTTQQSDSLAAKASGSTSTGLTATQVDLKLAPLTKSVSDIQKKAKTDSTTAETKRRKDSTTAATNLKAANDKIATLTSANTKLNDSLNIYKGILDVAIFTKSNGVITINIATLKSRLGLK